MSISVGRVEILTKNRALSGAGTKNYLTDYNNVTYEVVPGVRKTTGPSLGKGQQRVDSNRAAYLLITMVSNKVNGPEVASSGMVYTSIVATFSVSTISR